MPYNELIEDRIKKFISRWKNVDQKNMFGGVCDLPHSPAPNLSDVQILDVFLKILK